jgi:hypothetical protein
MNPSLKLPRLLCSILLLVAVLAGMGGQPSQAARQADPTPGALKPGAGPETPPRFGEERHGQGAPVAPQATGGPDHYGYTWSDVTIDWIEISATGVQATFPNADDSYTTAIGIGFNFKFYENTYSQLYIGTNGIVVFSPTTAYFLEALIPEDTYPNAFLAAFADDLLVGGGNNGKVYYQTRGVSPDREFVIEWYQVTSVTQPDTLTFEIVLHENGDIRFQYLDLNGVVTRAEVGIEDADGMDGLLYLRNAPGLEDNDAVHFTRPATAARRVKFIPKALSAFTVNDSASFKFLVRNTGDLGPDTFNLIAQTNDASWTAGLYQGNGVTPLSDTNGDLVKDTGALAQGATLEVVIQVKGWQVNQGDYCPGTLTVLSVANPAKQDSATFQAAVPAPFVQAYADSSVGIALDMVWENRRLANYLDSWYSGGIIGVLPVSDGRYVQAWERNTTNFEGRQITNLGYVIVDKHGMPSRAKGWLTDNYYPPQTGWAVMDRMVALATTPNGRIAAAWVRTIYDYNTSEYNSNVYLAVMFADGAVFTTTNVTKNTVWAIGGTLDAPNFYATRLTGTDDNRFVVAYAKYVSQTSGFVSDIYAAVHNADGEQVAAPIKLTASIPDDVRYDDPNVEALNGGRAFVAYSIYNQTTDGYIVAFSVINSAGTVVQGTSNLGSASGWNPEVLQMPIGEIAVAWTNAATLRISFAYLNNSNYAVEHGPINLANPDTRDVEAVSLTHEGSNLILTWMDYQFTLYLYYALYDGNANLITPPMTFYKGLAPAYNVVASQSGQGNAPFVGSYQLVLPSVLKLK